MGYFVAGLVLLLLGLGVWFILRNRPEVMEDRSETQMISFVALLEKPQYLEPVIVANAANRAWNVDLGNGADEGPDGFVIGGESPLPSMFIKVGERMVMVNNFPTPYVDDPDEVAEDIIDLRLQDLVRRHSAWISCDAMGVESFDDEVELGQWYRLLGRLMAELVDDNCLAIFLPLTGQAFPNIDETLELLKSEDPLAGLEADAPVPIVPIDDNDPRMIAAVEQARSKWPQFLQAFETKAGDNFAVKAPISRGGNTEFIWLTVTAIENGVIYGELANEPMNLGNLRLGSRVKASVDQLNDWAYFADDQPEGMFTVKILTDEAHKRKKNDEP